MLERLKKGGVGEGRSRKSIRGRLDGGKKTLHSHREIKRNRDGGREFPRKEGGVARGGEEEVD